MRISKYLKLNLPQAALDFVDVDTRGDTPVFLDPRALRLGTSQWGSECVSLIQSFFDCVLDAIREGRRDDAVALLRQLKEPNETHLGVSSGDSKGRALGPESAVDLYDALAGSEAVQTGLIKDLEETALMIPGIGFDIVSDIATNIIRGPLIDYTQHQAALLGFDDKLVAVDPGPMWDPSGQWYREERELPTTTAGKLLLVPKWIVRGTLHYNATNYMSTGVLDFLVEDEINQGGSLVTLLKDGTPRVYKKDLIEKYGQGKRVAAKLTLEHPEILDQYRHKRGKEAPAPLSHEELRERVRDATRIDWDGLVQNVRDVKPGKAGADAFHKASMALLTATLHPWLTSPVKEAPLHAGRKRLDIRYLNTAQSGFFRWFGDHFPASTVVVECKNYSSDPENPELDQLTGRFGVQRGKLGILVCRSFDDRALFVERCKDGARDERGWVLVLDDDDMAFLAECRKNDNLNAIHAFFLAQHEALVGAD